MQDRDFFEKKGDRYGDFIVTGSAVIDELQCRLIEILHEPSGSRIIHIANEDPENVFCIALRTLPESSDGVAHILEHTVLCGSEKFPVKDPFFSMTRRSLNTYMNALTGPDFTCYPAASQVVKDFYNLLEVYLDAVFHPRLHELSFLQEGHRLEFEVPEDPSTPLETKGVVYNEMKGALSSPLSRLWQSLMQELFPDILYRYNFGGEPKVISSLTYQQLLDFHHKYYQVGRACFYFYGNIPLKNHLDFLQKHAFKNVEPLTPIPANPVQPRLQHPKEVTHRYPVSSEGELEEKTFIALGWMTYPLKESMDLLTLQIIDIILMGTDAALLKKAVLKSGLCKNVFSVLEDELSQVPYAFVFEGCHGNDMPKIIDLVTHTLTHIIKEPIDAKLIDSALHHLEFSRTEITADHGPFGLSLILKLIPFKNVGCPIEDQLRIHTLFEKFRVLLQNPEYLPDFIKKYILENPHFIKLKMVPDHTLSIKEEEQEKEHLEKIKEKLSSEQTRSIVQKAGDLKAFQNEQEGQSLEVLPKVTLDDVSKKPIRLSLNQETIKKAHIFHHACFTNDIIYLDVVFKMPKISLEDLPYVKFFSYLLPHLGSKDRDYETNLNMIQNHTGGVAAFLDTYIPVSNGKDFQPALIIQGKALRRKKDFLLSLMYDMISSPNFDDAHRLKELLSQHFEEIDHDLKQNSLRYAINLSASGLSVYGHMQYFWGGLGYYEFIKKWAGKPKKELHLLIEKLKALKPVLLHGHNYDLLCSGDAEVFKDLRKDSFGKLCELETYPYTPWNADYPLSEVVSQGRITSSPVFFTSTALKTPGFADPGIPYLSIAARLFDNTLLHKLIREQGGAYGGGATNKMGTGQFCFYAYRDPNFASSLSAFRQACEKIARKDFSLRELEEAKLGILQKLDHPILPESGALTAYTWFVEGKDEAFRLGIRNRILDASPEDISEAVEKYLLHQINRATTVTFASKEALERENKKLEQSGQKMLEIRKL